MACGGVNRPARQREDVCPPPERTVDVQVVRCTNSLAPRLPAEPVRRLDLRESAEARAQLSVGVGLSIRPLHGNHQTFARELDDARAGMPIGDSVIADKGSGARY